jgi:hypothetical protein
MNLERHESVAAVALYDEAKQTGGEIKITRERAVRESYQQLCVKISINAV